jgi:hypothetical protein
MTVTLPAAAALGLVVGILLNPVVDRVTPAGS